MNLFFVCSWPLLAYRNAATAITLIIIINIKPAAHITFGRH